MPRGMGKDDSALYRARYTIVFPLKDGETEHRNWTKYLGPYRKVGAAKAAIKQENRTYQNGTPEVDGNRLVTEIEVADITWRHYDG